MLSCTLRPRSRSRRAQRPISWFAISKNAKAEDRLGSAASSYFVNIPLHLVLDYFDYELSRNGLFRAAAWVLNWVRGLPMGGPNSAQLACIYMAVRETKTTAVALFTPHILACRYRDNIYLFGRKSLLLHRLPEFQHALASYYCMPVQFEQMGSCIHVLEVSLCLHPKNDIHLQLHSKILSVANISRSNVQRWPNPWSPNVPSVLPSLCLGLASKCDFWARNGGINPPTSSLSWLNWVQSKSRHAHGSHGGLTTGGERLSHDGLLCSPMPLAWCRDSGPGVVLIG